MRVYPTMIIARSGSLRPTLAIARNLPYWDTDIAGFFSPAIPADYHAAHKPLIDGSAGR